MKRFELVNLRHGILEFFNFVLKENNHVAY